MKLTEYIRARAAEDAALEELDARLMREQSVTDYNLMMGNLDDPEEGDDE